MAVPAKYAAWRELLCARSNHPIRRRTAQRLSGSWCVTPLSIRFPPPLRPAHALPSVWGQLHDARRRMSAFLCSTEANLRIEHPEAPRPGLGYSNPAPPGRWVVSSASNTSTTTRAAAAGLTTICQPHPVRTASAETMRQLVLCEVVEDGDEAQIGSEPREAALFLGERQGHAARRLFAGSDVRKLRS